MAPRVGLGNIGPLAAKPIMEGKAALFNACADVQATDIVIDQEDPDRFIQTVTDISPSFRGINLEDIKAPSVLYRTNIGRKTQYPRIS